VLSRKSVEIKRKTKESDTKLGFYKSLREKRRTKRRGESREGRACRILQSLNLR